MKNLAKQIQKEPSRKDELLDSYETDSKEVRDFLNSLKNVVVYVVPALLEAFNKKLQENGYPKTLSDLMSDKVNVGTVLCIQGDIVLTYVGISPYGNPLCRDIDSDIVHELSSQTEISYLI